MTRDKESTVGEERHDAGVGAPNDARDASLVDTAAMLSAFANVAGATGRGVQATVDALAAGLAAVTGAAVISVHTTALPSDHDAREADSATGTFSATHYGVGGASTRAAVDDALASLDHGALERGGPELTRRRLATPGGEIDAVGASLRADSIDGTAWVLSHPNQTFSRAGVEAARSIVAAFGPLLGATGRIEALSRTNATLYDTAELFRAMFEQSVVGVAFTHLDGHIIRVNAAFCRLVGYEAHELIGQNSRAYTTEATWGRHEEHVRVLRDGDGSSATWEKEYIRKDGSLVTALVSASPVRSASGRTIGIVGVIQDITDRKRVASELRHERERTDATLRAADVGRWTSLSDERRIEGDPIFMRMLGVQEWSDKSAPMDEVARRVHPEDLARVGAAFRGAADGTMIETEYRVMNADGSVRWVLARGHVFRGPGGGARATGIVMDVTARREAEDALRESVARYRLAMRATENAVWDWNITTGEVQWNIGVESLFGHPVDLDTQSFESWAVHVHPDDRLRFKASISAAIGDPAQDEWREEYRFLRADGTYADVLDRGSILRDESSRAVRMIGVLQDLSERKRTERERERVLASERLGRVEAERTSQLKDEFLATLSHELRTPLNAILGWSQLLKNGRDGKVDVARGLEVIERNARSQAQIIEDLLDMSRIVSGRVRLEPRPVELAEIVRAAIDTARLSAEAKHLDLTLASAQGPTTVMGDPARLQQVMWNLLSNAVKFTGSGGRIDITLARVDAHVRISVVDTGEGIPSEFLPHVFDRFRQADASATRRHGGLGIGLSLVKQLVELHGGTVSVTSPGPSLGATFTISLPAFVASERRTSAPDVGAGVRPAQGSSPVPPSISLTRLRVLVVDDDPDARLLVEQVLGDAGAEVAAVGSASAAIALLTAREFDVLVSDIGMPQEDGYALLRRARALGRTLPAIALTAYAGAEDRVRALVAGFKMHVPKPVESTELIATVASAAGRT